MKKGALVAFGPDSLRPNEVTFDLGFIEHLGDETKLRKKLLDGGFHKEFGIFESWAWEVHDFKPKRYQAMGFAAAGGGFAGVDIEDGRLTGLLFGFGSSPGPTLFGIFGDSRVIGGPFQLSKREMHFYASIAEGAFSELGNQADLSALGLAQKLRGLPAVLINGAYVNWWVNVTYGRK